MPETIVEVTIKHDTGDSEVDVQGHHGKGCQAIADAFKMGKVTNEVKKASFNDPGQGSHVSVGH